MKSGIVSWVSHSNMPILSVDVQPNGFRFVTGGSDHKVTIWNLLPAISAKYENPRMVEELEKYNQRNSNENEANLKAKEDNHNKNSSTVSV